MNKKSTPPKLNVSATPPRYQTYVLRCWQERSTQADGMVTVWRFSLEDPRTNRRQGFASMEALLASLQTELLNE
jgi:hypothetical protein